jgi:hypothetical protein
MLVYLKEYFIMTIFNHDDIDDLEKVGMLFECFALDNNEILAQGYQPIELELEFEDVI